MTRTLSLRHCTRHRVEHIQVSAAESEFSAYKRLSMRARCCWQEVRWCSQGYRRCARGYRDLDGHRSPCSATRILRRLLPANKKFKRVKHRSTQIFRCLEAKDAQRLLGCRSGSRVNGQAHGSHYREFSSTETGRRCVLEGMRTTGSMCRASRAVKGVVPLGAALLIRRDVNQTAKDERVQK